MKTIIRIFFLLLPFWLVPFAIGQQLSSDGAGGVPPGLGFLEKLQLNGVTAMVVIRAIGELYSSIRAGGGLIGIWRALLYGQNVPKPILQDYKAELASTPPPPPS